jgi:hypothetical protein
MLQRTGIIEESVTPMPTDPRACWGYKSESPGQVGLYRRSWNDGPVAEMNAIRVQHVTAAETTADWMLSSAITPPSSCHSLVRIIRREGEFRFGTVRIPQSGNTTTGLYVVEHVERVLDDLRWNLGLRATGPPPQGLTNGSV